MHKNVRYLLCMCLIFTVTTGSNVCPNTVKYEIVTLNQNYTYDTEKFETEVISPSENAFSITLEGDIPVLCKKMLQITQRTYHFYGSNTGIEKIEAGTFENQNITSQLRLSYNSITVIKTGTFKNILITELDLTRNKIVTIEEGAIQDLPKLTTLYLGWNKIKEFYPNSVSLTPQLSFFDMSRNKMEKLDERHFSFMNKERNVGVGLGENKLKEIHPNAFERIDIFVLNLTGNHLSSIPKEVFVNNMLQYLDIAYNDLTHLDQEFFDMNTTILRDVHLEGNNFDKETLAKLEPFMKIIEKNREEDQKYHQIDDVIYS